MFSITKYFAITAFSKSLDYDIRILFICQGIFFKNYDAKKPKYEKRFLSSAQQLLQHVYNKLKQKSAMRWCLDEVFLRNWDQDHSDW